MNKMRIKMRQDVIASANLFTLVLEVILKDLQCNSKEINVQGERFAHLRFVKVKKQLTMELYKGSIFAYIWPILLRNLETEITRKG